MPTSLTIILLFLSFGVLTVFGTSIICDEGVSGQCYESIVNCTDYDDSDCTVHCSSESGCHSANIYCGSNCSVICDEQWSCRNAIIHIPMDSSSSIQCSNTSACAHSIVHIASDSSVDLQCGDESCYNITVDATSNRSTLDMNCSGTWNCDSAQIIGGTNSSINLLCDGDERSASCFSAEIDGGFGSIINVSCHSERSCDLMTIDGRDAALLTLNDCTESDSCSGMEIWCPQRTDSEIRCILEGNDNLDIVKLYAVNSWNDIEFQTSSKTQWESGYMYCTEGYREHCQFGVNTEWQCDDITSICAAVSTTEPTISPTHLPSTSPTVSPIGDSKMSSKDQTVIYIVVSVLGGLTLLVLLCCFYKATSTSDESEVLWRLS